MLIWEKRFVFVFLDNVPCVYTDGNNNRDGAVRYLQTKDDHTEYAKKNNTPNDRQLISEVDARAEQTFIQKTKVKKIYKRLERKMREETQTLYHPSSCPWSSQHRPQTPS